MALRRIRKELKNIQKDPPNSMFSEDQSVKIYIIGKEIVGPTESPYEGGLFFSDIRFPLEYPFKPQK